MRNEFLKGMLAVPKIPPRWKEYTLEINSTARIENYAWLSPPPRFQRYLGKRRYANLDNIRYPIQNLEYSAELSVSTRDIEDDQIGAYPIRFAQLGQDSKDFPGRLCVQALANGANVVCFDGTNYFASAHNQGGCVSVPPSPFGGGFNNLTYTSANTSDGVVNKAVFLLHYEMIKPVFYQKRKGPTLNTTSGTPQALEAKQANYFADLEAAVGYGFPWDGILVTITNTPSLTDIFTVIDQVMKQFWGMTLPAALPTDANLFVHQGITFTPEVGTIISGIGLGRLFEHALKEDRVGVSVAGSTGGITSNIYKGTFALEISGYMI